MTGQDGKCGHVWGRDGHRSCWSKNDETDGEFDNVSGRDGKGIVALKIRRDETGWPVSFGQMSREIFVPCKALEKKVVQLFETRKKNRHKNHSITKFESINISPQSLRTASKFGRMRYVVQDVSCSRNLPSYF